MEILVNPSAIEISGSEKFKKIIHILRYEEALAYLNNYKSLAGILVEKF